MKVAPIMFGILSLTLGTLSIFFAYETNQQPVEMRAPEFGASARVVSATGTLSMRSVKYIENDEDGPHITCSIIKSSLDSCDDSAKGDLTVDVPEYGASSTPARLLAIAEEVMPIDVTDTISQLRIYAHSENDTAAYVEREDDDSWLLGVTLDPHLFREGGIDETSLKVTLAHEWGHIIEEGNPQLQTIFLSELKKVNEPKSLIKNTLGEQAADDPNEDFAESYAMFLARKQPIGVSEEWRMRFFERELPGRREQWRGKLSKGELADFEQVWALSHEAGRSKK